MFDRAYIEITNICNRACAFCPKTKRAPRFMSVEDFRLYAGKLRALTDCFYLHVMGEPLCHPRLDEILGVCDELRARVVITTNGTLLKEKGALLLAHGCVYKVQISLHSFEANGEGGGGEEYFSDCFDFAERSAGRGIVTILRLWNRDGRLPGANSRNDELLAALRARFDGFWSENKRGYCISPKLYLEYGERFLWPAEGGEALLTGGSCRALRDQIAVLCDGTVVPCCMDAEGVMALGDLNTEDLLSILESPTASAMRAAFEKKDDFYMPFCRTCGYAERFNQDELSSEVQQILNRRNK